jgi:hypothetical protein
MRHISLKLQKLEERIAPGGCGCGGGSASHGSKGGGSKSHGSKGGGSKSHGSKGGGSKSHGSKGGCN